MPSFFKNRTYFCLFHFSNREEIGICPISFFRVGEVSLLVSFFIIIYYDKQSKNLLKYKIVQLDASEYVSEATE
nr:MAG TPA: hypothetical protein [Caudoviricetes sp.]